LIDSQLPAATITAAVDPDSAISVYTLLTLTISRLNSNPPSSATTDQSLLLLLHPGITTFF